MEMEKAISGEWRIVTLHKQCAFHLLKKHGVHAGQLPLLFALKQHGPCRQNALAHTLMISPATIAVSLQRMERSGLLKRIPDPSDLRSNALS